MNLRATDRAVTVGELTAVIRGLLEEGIGSVVVTGEISNFKQHSSGHRYFTLKDADASISCVMWRSRTLDSLPEDGTRVMLSGKITVYAPRGNYQIDVTSIRPEGIGDLHAAFEALKKKLLARGWFDQERKKPLPRFPRKIGIATAATGAAVQDMFSTLNRRFAPLEVIFRQTLVQGHGAAEDIAQAIIDLNATDVDLIIVGRGGGSIEDLWSFNTEIVAEAIFNSRVAVISAVGHETDTTIADYVADRRAETPTAAAEMATPVTSDDLLQSLDLITERLTDTVVDRIRDLAALADEFSDGTAARRIEERVRQLGQRVKDLEGRMASAISHYLQIHQQSIQHLTTHIQTLHPHRPLKLGYAIVERNGKPLAITDTLKPGEEVSLLRATEAHTATISTTTPRVIEDHGKEED